MARPALHRALARVALGAILIAAVAHGAQPERSRLAQARKEYLAQEYERVVRLLVPLVASQVATISEKVDAYELLGLSYLILGETRRAREAFENLLELDSGHVLRDASGSPKIQRFYESVRESFVPGYRTRAPVTLEHTASTGAVAGRRLEIGAHVAQGAKEIGQVLVRWRRAGLLGYESVAMRRQGAQLVVGFVAPEDTSAYELEYYIEVRAPGGQTLTRVGSPDRPLTITVSGAPARRVPLVRRWWFWTAIGVAVVGGATAGIVAAVRETAPDGNLSPGVIKLR
jgi:hypothetical protein